MDTMNVVTLFLFNIVLCNIPLLYGTVGEILTEKAGSLNLGVEGTMAVGAIFGYLAGCAANSLLVGLLVSFLAAGLCGLLFALLTVTFQANQNVTGLTITTFGLGLYFFVGKGIGDSGGRAGVALPQLHQNRITPARGGGEPRRGGLRGRQHYPV